MYLLSQLWLYLLLACLAGLALGLLLNRICQQRRHAAQLAALETQQRDDRSRHELALVSLREEHVRTTAALQADLSHHQTLLSAENGRATALLASLITLQDTHASTIEAQDTAARQAAEALASAQAELEACQSAALLREPGLRQELAEAQSRGQGLEVELRTLRLTLAENDDQLATLGARLQAERDHQASLDAALNTLREEHALQQQQAQARIDELTQSLAEAGVRTPSPRLPVIVRPAPSAAATMTSAELERLVLAAGPGLQPVPVEIDEQHPDDLKVIDGIGPVNERWLHAQGVHYFWQIACWSPEELAWVAHHLPNFGSRVYRENWVAQAAKLATQSLSRS